MKITFVKTATQLMPQIIRRDEQRLLWTACKIFNLPPTSDLIQNMSPVQVLWCLENLNLDKES